MNENLLFHAITLLFLVAVLGESGLGKLLDYKGNLAYFKGQFKNSPLAAIVGLLFPVITLMELGTAVLSVVGLLQLVSTGHYGYGLWAVVLANLTFIALIFGQRMAKDYGGAAGIVPYLAVAIIGLYGVLHTG